MISYTELELIKKIYSGVICRSKKDIYLDTNLKEFILKNGTIFRINKILCSVMDTCNFKGTYVIVELQISLFNELDKRFKIHGWYKNIKEVKENFE